MLDWMKVQAEIKIARRSINEELKSFLMNVKEESEKSGLKLNIQTSKIMASGPITSWQNRWGKKWKQ